MAENYTLAQIDYYRTIHPFHNPERRGISSMFLAWRGKRKIRYVNLQASASGDSISGPSKKQFLFGFGFLRSKIGQLLRFLNTGVTWVEEKIMFRMFRQRILEVAEQTKAEFVHAHTPYRVGIPALWAARKLGIPFVYEMRGMWEETAVGSGRWKSWGPSYRRFRRIETKLLRRADAVICISETLRQEAISRGVDSAKITIVPNAVNPNLHSDAVESSTISEVKESLALGNDTVVVGYIGSLRSIEGVDQTAEAVAILSKQGLDVRFFALTSSSGQTELMQHCKTLDIADKSVIAGPVPHAQVMPFYDLIDIFVVSRPKTRVTSLVTPLKPFEAMMAGRAVICSDLPALAEIVDDGKTGLLYSVDDIDDLASKINQLVIDAELRSTLGTNAQRWVEAERKWSVVAQKGLVAYAMAQSNMPQ